MECIKIYNDSRFVRSFGAPAATSCLDSQSSPSANPVPLVASHACMCHDLPQQSLYKENVSVISSIVAQPATSYKFITNYFKHTVSISGCFKYHLWNIEGTLILLLLLKLFTCLFAKISRHASLSISSDMSLTSSPWASDNLSLLLESITKITA